MEEHGVQVLSLHWKELRKTLNAITSRGFITLTIYKDRGGFLMQAVVRDWHSNRCMESCVLGHYF